MKKEEQRQGLRWARHRQNDPAFRRAKQEIAEEKKESFPGEGSTPKQRRLQLERIREAHSRLRASLVRDAAKR